MSTQLVTEAPPPRSTSYLVTRERIDPPWCAVIVLLAAALGFGLLVVGAVSLFT